MQDTGRHILAIVLAVIGTAFIAVVAVPIIALLVTIWSVFLFFTLIVSTIVSVYTGMVDTISERL